MKTSSHRHTARATRKSEPNQRGFSLIVTITMLILLSLIAVGLLSLSSVTLRSSSSDRAANEAKANARIAMAIALGELQRLAGPDQRVTATADIAGGQNGEALTAGGAPTNDSSLDSTNKGLSSVQPGTRYWTGVFTNNDDPTLIYNKTPSASLQGWLVSNPAGAIQSGVNGVTPGNSTYVANSDGTAASPNDAIVLVGNNTFGNRSSGADNFVTAPLVTISDGTNQTGSYAWWVGDEGVKSRINNSNQLQNGQNFAALSPQRRGWEIVNGITNYPESGDANQTNLERLPTLPSTELLIGEPAANIGLTDSLFHAATAYSVGLHTNTLEGGLKVDLTTALEGGLSAGGNPTIDNYPSRGTPIIPALATNTTQPLNLLTWERLEPFYNRIKNSSPSASLTVEAESFASGGSGNSSYAIAPTIVEVRLVLGARLKGRQSGRGTSTTSVTVDPCGKVLFVLANPIHELSAGKTTLISSSVI